MPCSPGPPAYSICPTSPFHTYPRCLIKILPPTPNSHLSLVQILGDAHLKLDFHLPNWLFLHISSKYRTVEAFKNYLVTNETVSNLSVAAHVYGYGCIYSVHMQYICEHLISDSPWLVFLVALLTFLFCFDSHRSVWISSSRRSPWQQIVRLWRTIKACEWSSTARHGKIGPSAGSNPPLPSQKSCQWKNDGKLGCVIQWAVSIRLQRKTCCLCQDNGY